MAEWKNLELTSSHEHTSITTNCEQPSIKKNWNLPKKILYIHRHKKETTTKLQIYLKNQKGITEQVSCLKEQVIS